MGEMVTVFDAASGRDRPMTRRDLILLKEKVAQDEQGRFRAVASRSLSGKFLGEFRYLVIHFTLVVNQAILGLAPLAAKIGAIERGLSKASGGVH